MEAGFGGWGEDFPPEICRTSQGETLAIRSVKNSSGFSPTPPGSCFSIKLV